jgi:ubiquinone/menaquinone biosynthesis C-methylase UbiE
MNTVLNRKLDFDKTLADFRKVVRVYDIWSRLTESKALEKVIELANIKDNRSIIEIACGTGSLFEKIVNLNPNGRNIGLDLSPDMLHRADIRLQKNGLKNYELYKANILDLNEKFDSFDLLINNFMIDLMPEDTFDNIAAEFYKLLKPDGTALISTFSFGTKRIHRFWFWLAKHAPDLLTGCRPVTFKNNLEKAGFEIIEIYQISQNTFPTEIIKAKK